MQTASKVLIGLLGVGGIMVLAKRANAAAPPPANGGELDQGGPAPTGGGVITIPQVTITGDPSSINWGADVLAAAHDLEQVLNPHGSSCYKTWGTPPGVVLAFQQAYNDDPTSKNKSNVLGTAQAPVYALAEDDKFGSQTRDALMYVTGDIYDTSGC